MLKKIFVTIFILCLNAASFAADNDRVNTFQPNVKPALDIRRASGPIQIDGDLNDAGWLDAARAKNFTEIRPGDQTQPPVETESLVAYDDANLYVAFLAHDNNPQSIRATLQDRDAIWQDDFVGIMLDTYGDGAWAYEIFANPLGIQSDARWTSQNEDDGFNIVYHSKGKVTDAGYQVEMAIPFSSLRFPDRAVQNWRITFFRTHPRDSRRQYSWSTVSRDNPCFPCQFGTMTGIENVKPGGSLELLPSVVGFQSGSLREQDSRFVNQKVDGAASVGLQYAFTPSLVAEATYNPDFSQVESDAAQIDVNTSFALFYPERRPFFQEGSDLFDTFYNAFYTRSINDPVVAAKLTGRLNRTSLAYVGARDEHSPLILPFEERSAILQTGRSTSNILRARRTFGEDSYIGGMLTDRRLEGGGAGTLYGADGVFRFKKNYRFEWQAVFSHTKEPNNANLTAGISQRQTHFDNGKYTTAFDGESFKGNAVYASFEREAKHWNFDFDYWASSPTFRADNGFVTRNNDRRTSVWTTYNFYPNTKIFDRINPALMAGRFWNHSGVRKDDWIRPRLNLQFKKQTYVFLGSVFSTELYRNIEFRGIRRIELNVNSNFSKPVELGLWFSYGRSIARNLATPVLGRGFDFQTWSTLKPLQRLIIQPEFSYSELNHPNGAEIFSGYILRNRVNYQFTRELFLRMIVQYNNFDKGLSLEPLLSYKLNPFTIFYLGATQQYLDLDPETGARDFTQTSRQFFMKFQYLVRI